jgi:hypothetical protein
MKAEVIRESRNYVKHRLNILNSELSGRLEMIRVSGLALTITASIRRTIDLLGWSDPVSTASSTYSAHISVKAV